MWPTQSEQRHVLAKARGQCVEAVTGTTGIANGDSGVVSFAVVKGDVVGVTIRAGSANLRLCAGVGVLAQH